MTDRTLKYTFGLTSTLLLIGLLFKMSNLPGGFILPGYVLGGMLLAGALVGCVVIAVIARIIFNRNSWLTLFSIITTLVFLAGHYIFYSPTLKIVVPKGYTGAIVLVLSNVDKNILTVDTNGIGYVDKWTFDKTYLVPIVVDVEGRNMNDQCVGFNPSTFWAKGTATSSENSVVIRSISFEIVPTDKAGQKQYYNKDLTNLVDRRKLR